MASGGDAAASALAFAQALGQLQRAKMADAEASKFAAQTGATLAHAKTAIAAAARQEAAEVAKAAAAQRAAAKEQEAAAAAAVKAAAQVAREQKKAADEQARAQKKAHKEAEDAAKQAAATQKQAAQDWNDSGALMTSPIEMVKKALSGFGPEGQAAAMALGLATAAVTALSAAILGGMATAIGVVEKMTQRLAVFSALGGSAAAGKATLDMVNRLADRLPFTTDQLSQWDQAMQRAGMQGKGLESAVKAIAAAAAINPEGGAAAAEEAIAKLSGEGQGAAKFLKQIQNEAGKGEKSLRSMGLSMADLGGKAAVAKMTAQQLQQAIEKALVTKGNKGPLEAMMNTWPVILDKAKAGFASLFSGLDGAVGPFMKSVREMFGMFNKGSPTMAALRGVITSVFGTLFSWATRAVGVVTGVFQQIVIAGLKVRIAINPIWLALRQLSAELSKAAVASGLFSGKSTTMAGVLMVAKVVIVGAFNTAIAVVTGFLRVLTFMVSTATLVVTKVKAAFRNLSLPSLAAAAGNMITSFISGITSKIGSVMAAMTSMGQAAKAGLLAALGIHSPSRVALEAAGNVTSTFADTVDDGKSDAQRAFSGMVKVPPPARTGGGSSGGATAALVAVLDRVAAALEMNPGQREALVIAFAEEAQSS